MQITFLRDKIRTDEGGASFSLHLLAEQLTDRGHDVEVVTVHHSGLENVVPPDHDYTLTSKPIDNYTQIDGAVRIHRVLDEIPAPDVLHSFQPQLHPIVAAWKRREPTVAVVGRLNSYRNFCTNVSQIADGCYENCTLRRKWAHHPDPSPGGLPKMAFDTWVQPTLLNEFDAFNAQSPAVKDIFAGVGVDEERMTVIPNFYETRFGDPFPPTRPQTDVPYRGLFVGRLAHEKGLHLLLEAVKQAAVDVTVDVLGEGPERDTLEAQAGPKVNFHGWVDHEDLPQYYRRADVYLHPGLWPDPCPRSVIEAMQFDCVPVVSDTGGPPWMTGEAGRVVPRDDAGELATALEELAEYKKRVNYRKVLPDVLDRFAPERILDRLTDTYQSVI